MKMPSSASFLCASLVLCVAVSQSFGHVLPEIEKKGWTINSAGYLLGPQAMEDYRLLSKMLAKRNLQFEDNVESGKFHHISDETATSIVMEFLEFLHLKAIGALVNLPSLFPSELGQS